MAYNYLHKEAKGFYMQLDFELDPSIYPIGSTFEDYRGGLTSRWMTRRCSSTPTIRKRTWRK